VEFYLGPWDGDEDLVWHPDQERWTPNSLPDDDYNCFGYAVDDGKSFWTHELSLTNAGYYWPDGVPRSETIEAYSASFATRGWEVCEDGSLEEGFEKVVLYAKNNGTQPWHASRQLADGTWVTKFGTNADAVHAEVEALTSRALGRPVRFFRRRRVGPV